MPIATQFEYVKPADMDEALQVLAMYKEKARPLAGGTDLIVHLKEGFAKPEIVLDVKALKELSGLSLKNGVLRVGALVTFAELLESAAVKKNFPDLWEAAGTVASTGVRNRATLAGNICSAVPSADSAPPLLAHDAVVRLRSQAGERLVSIHEWFTGPKRTALGPDELVVSVEVGVPEKKFGACYMKLSRYDGEDLAQGGVEAAVFTDHNYRVAFCALGPVPARALRTEAYLKGKKVTEQTVKQAGELLAGEISPISDIRSSKEYRVHMAKIMLGRALETAVSRLSGRGPKYGEGNIC